MASDYFSAIALKSVKKIKVIGEHTNNFLANRL